MSKCKFHDKVRYLILFSPQFCQYFDGILNIICVFILSGIYILLFLSFLIALEACDGHLIHKMIKYSNNQVRCTVKTVLSCSPNSLTLTCVSLNVDGASVTISVQDNIEPCHRIDNILIRCCPYIDGTCCPSWLSQFSINTKQ